MNNQAATQGKVIYHYKKRDHLLSAAERECLSILEELNDNYLIFAQIHLASLLNEKTPNQCWRAAFRHEDEKSVDFVICEKINVEPILVIELDDITHRINEKVRARDIEVGRMLKEAQIPLYRINNPGQPGSLDRVKILSEIRKILNTSR